MTAFSTSFKQVCPGDQENILIILEALGGAAGCRGRKIPVLFILRALECLNETYLDSEDPSRPLRDTLIPRPHGQSSPSAPSLKQMEPWGG